MKTLFQLAGAAMLSALPVQAIAATPAPKCVTRAELRTGIAYLMPTLVGAVVDKCRQTLPDASYLSAQGDMLLDRYKAEAGGSETDVLALMARFLPMGEMGEVDSKTAKTFINAAISAGIQSELKTNDCADISEGLSFLDPLPAANMIGLVEFIAVKINDDNAKKAAMAADGAATKKGKRPSKPFLCPSETAMSVGAKG
jgi:hypothetical protein